MPKMADRIYAGLLVPYDSGDLLDGETAERRCKLTQPLFPRAHPPFW